MKTIKAWAILDIADGNISTWVWGSMYADNKSYQIFPTEHLARHFHKLNNIPTEKVIEIEINYEN